MWTWSMDIWTTALHLSQQPWGSSFSSACTPTWRVVSRLMRWDTQSSVLPSISACRLQRSLHSVLEASMGRVAKSLKRRWADVLRRVVGRCLLPRTKVCYTTSADQNDRIAGLLQGIQSCSPGTACFLRRGHLCTSHKAYAAQVQVEDQCKGCKQRIWQMQLRREDTIAASGCPCSSTFRRCFLT